MNSRSTHLFTENALISFRIYLLFYLFSPSSHLTVVCVFPVGLSSLMTFSTGLVSFQNVVLTTKGLQERNIQLLDGMTVEK